MSNIRKYTREEFNELHLSTGESVQWCKAQLERKYLKEAIDNIH